AVSTCDFQIRRFIPKAEIIVQILVLEYPNQAGTGSRPANLGGIMTHGLIRWNPETGLLRGRMDQVFNQMLRDFWNPTPSEATGNRAWMPAVDIREEADALVLTAELPGLTKDQVDVTLENNVLTIAGERKF